MVGENMVTQWSIIQPWKKNEILSFAAKWIELEDSLGDISQTQKNKNHTLSLKNVGLKVVELLEIWKYAGLEEGQQERLKDEWKWSTLEVYACIEPSQSLPLICVTNMCLKKKDSAQTS